MNHFSFVTLILITWLLYLPEFLKSCLPKAKQKWKTSLISRQQLGLNWAASWWNSSNLTIDGSKWGNLTWNKMIVRSKTVSPLSSYRYKTNQVIDLQEHLEQYCNVFPVFGFNSAKHFLNLIKSFWFPFLVNIEPTVIKRTNQFSSLKFCDFQLLDIIKFLRGATSLDSILKACKTLETKTFFPYKWFDHPVKMQNTELPPYAAFYSELRSCNPLEAEHNYYVDLLKSGLITGLPKPPPTGVENY